jgi:hypothetical protein
MSHTIPFDVPFAETTGVAPGKLNRSIEADVGFVEMIPLTKENAFSVSPLPQKYKFPFQ